MRALAGLFFYSASLKMESLLEIYNSHRGKVCNSHLHSCLEHVLIEKKLVKETDERFLLRGPGRMLFHKKIRNFWSPFEDST